MPKKQNKVNRKPTVAGMFYPANEVDLRNDLVHLFSNAKERQTSRVRALFVPHAGYVFSGTVAASAYNQIIKDSFYEHIFIIASSHHIAANIISTYVAGNYETPLGNVCVDTNLTSKFMAESNFIRYEPEADLPEHSIEVQLPFIQYWLHQDCKIVPFIICTWNKDVISSFSKLIEPYFTDKNLFIISTDFSHYPSYNDACLVDKETANAICFNSSSHLLEVIQKHKHNGMKHLDTDLCGWTSVLAMLYITERQKQLSFQLIDYANSGDSEYGDEQRVVGYNAIVVTD